jgi:hypothetical protein
MTYIYNAPESDVRYAYQWEILKTALDKTSDKYGDYSLIRSKAMTEKRQTYELKKQTGEISVMYLGTEPVLEKELLAIHIPVDKNLGGYSLLLIVRRQCQICTLKILSACSIHFRCIFGLPGMKRV